MDDQKHDLEEKEEEVYDNNQEEQKTTQMASQLTTSRRLNEPSANEKKHQSVDDDDDDVVDDRPRLDISFKWDQKQDKDNCDTKHMFYLLWLSFVMVQDRQKERNASFKNYGREDRILKCPDLVQAMTNFIDWHLKDLDNNNFDGKYVKDTPRMDVCEKIKEVAGVKEGWCIKIYKYLTKDVQEPSGSGTVTFPNYKHKAIGIALESLTVEDMKTLLTKEEIGIFALMEKQNAVKGKLEGFEDEIVQFFVDEKVDGAKIISLKRRNFIAAIKKYLIESDKEREKEIKTKSSAFGKIYVLIEKADLNRILK